MRYPAAEKLEIIRLVEQSALPVRPTLEKIGIPRATDFYLSTVLDDFSRYIMSIARRDWAAVGHSI